MSKYVLSPSFTNLDNRESLCRLFTIPSQIPDNSIDVYIAMDISSEQEPFIRMVNVDSKTIIYEFNSDDEALLWYKLNY